MMRLEGVITFLLVASFALLLIPVISTSASSRIFFAEATTFQDIWRIRVGMWGACSPGVSFGSGNRDIRGCTSGRGAYALQADLPVESSDPFGPPEHTTAQLLSASQTGPLLCALVSMLMLVPAFGLWFHDVFAARRKDILCFVCLVISTVLAWISMSYGGELAGKLDHGLDAYRNSEMTTHAYTTHRGNAVWCCLGGAIAVTVATLLVAGRRKNTISVKNVNRRNADEA